MSVKKPSRWDKVSRWDKDFNPARKELSLKSGRDDPTHSRNNLTSADDRTTSTEKTSLIDTPGLIFMCNRSTKHDCFHYKVFGLPLARRDLVERVVPGTLLFLFDIDSRQLHGIYKAVSHGGMNLEPMAFLEFRGSYPAQVRFDVHRECLPLSEDIFKDALKESYYAANKFNLDLTPQQVSKLVQLFKPLESLLKKTDSQSIASRIHKADFPRLGLAGNSTGASDPTEQSHRDSQYRLFSDPSKIEGILGYSLSGHHAQGQDGYGSVLSRKRLYDHAFMETTLLPRTRLDEHNLIDPLLSKGLDKLKYVPSNVDASGKGLLDSGGMDEVDQLAMKYIQQSNTGVGGDIGLYSMDHIGRNSAASATEDMSREGLAPISQPDLAHLTASIGAERHAEIELRDRALRNHERNIRSSHFIPDSNISERTSMTNWSSAAAVSRYMGASESLRQQPVGHITIRRS